MTRQARYREANRDAINAQARARGLKPWEKLNKRDRYKMARTGSAEFRQTLEKRCLGRAYCAKTGQFLAGFYDVEAVLEAAGERALPVNEDYTRLREERERHLWESPRSSYE